VSDARLNDRLAARVERELRAKLERAAEEDRRPLASLVRIIIADWLARRASEHPQRRRA